MGMFCLLCMKHVQGEARLVPFCEKPSVRMRPGTLGDHLSSASHKSSVQVEHTQRVSHFHKLAVQKDAVQDAVLQSVFLSAYWLAKEEVPNKKFPSLLQLLEHTGNDTMKFFMHRSQQSTLEIFHTIGEEIRNRTIDAVTNSSAVGLLCDDAMDVSVIEQFIGFVQFYDSRMQNVEVKFLFAEDALQNSDSANSQALHDIVVSQFEDIGLQKLSGLCTDGASVMVGRLATISQDVKIGEPTYKWAEQFCDRYINALIANLEKRFDKLPVVAAFSIFQVEDLPNRDDCSFQDYGKDNIKELSLHFDFNQEELMSEWQKIKYNFVSWKKAEVLTAELCMKKILALRDIFPSLSHLAEVGLALPVSNAWPERGVSCLKRLKTRLRSRMSQKMLNSLMMISINGPKLFSQEAKEVIGAAVENWLSSKKRRRLPRTMMPTDRRDFTNEPEFEQSEAEPEEEMTKETEEEEMAGIEDQEAEEHSAQEAFSLFHLSPDDIRDKEDDDNSAKKMRLLIMESELAGPGWMKFNCKSGELLFYYNNDTAEHKFPMWNSISREYCMGETIDGQLLQTNNNNSIAIQTDDTGCSNGCMSMYAASGCIVQDSNLEREIPGGSGKSELAGPGWMKFNCKSGELLFYYNKDTAEHKFPMWNSTSREYCVGETIDGESLKTNKNNSIAIQTDDTSCSNGCTSMYAESGCVLQESNLERDISGGSEETSEYCMGETIDGEFLQTNNNNSIAIQTDDTGCSNGCTSMYAESGCSILQESNLEREIPRGSEETSECCMVETIDGYKPTQNDHFGGFRPFFMDCNPPKMTIVDDF
ncbi:hypothetical protein QZH41_005804 [Actinostola sp. cb2023]|nr:hypothetical protein QZH41_005804 [Actinostola sp. cb2023]